MFKLIFIFYMVRIVTGQNGPFWPGPQSVVPNGNGGSSWTAQVRNNVPGQVTTYTVKELVNIPTVVYNCAYMLSICQNAAQYMGALTTQNFIYDRLKDPNNGTTRTDARRDANCPDNWITSNRKPDGSLRCPATNQPAWYNEFDYNNNVNGPEPSLLWKDLNGNPDQNNRQMGRFEQYVLVNNQPPPVAQYTKEGAVFTCEEFPPASWIQGGAGAFTSCAPMSSTCRLSVVAARTEQNWQGDSHNMLAKYFQQAAEQNGWGVTTVDHPLWTVYGFHFRMDNDPNTGDAAWLELGGQKKYCYGPTASTGAACPGINWALPIV